MIETISIAQAAMLTQSRRTTIERQIKSGKLITRRLPSKKQKGKFVTGILVTSLPVEIQKKLAGGINPPLSPFAKGEVLGGELDQNLDPNPAGAPRRSSTASRDAATISAGRAERISVRANGCQPSPGHCVAGGDGRANDHSPLQTSGDVSLSGQTHGSAPTANPPLSPFAKGEVEERNKIQRCTAEEILTWYQTLSEPARARVEARRAVLLKWEDMRYNAGAGDILEQALDKTIRLEQYCADHQISIGCFYRWQKSYSDHGLIGLADFRFGSARSKLTQGQKDYIAALIKQNPDRRDVKIWEYVVAELTVDSAQLPATANSQLSTHVSYTTVRRYVAAWKKQNHELYTFMCSPDKWKSQYMVAFGSASEKAKHFLHYIEMDSSPADLLCADGQRYNLTGLIDIYSRKVIIKVTPTSNSQSIAATLRGAIVNWGIPGNLVRDNGKDFTSNHINRILDELEITTHTAAPFTPEAKPHIERFFRTIAYDLFEDLAGYIGHNVAQRKDIESRRSFAKRFMRSGEDPIAMSIMPDQLQQIIDNWLHNVYHTRVHRGIETTPDIKSAQSTVAVRRVANERALDILLLAAGGAVVNKKGIRHQNALYQSPELAGWVKAKVQVRRDLDDAGRLYVFSAEGDFICIARDRSIAGISAAECAEAKKVQRQRINAQKKAIVTLTGESMPGRARAQTKKIVPLTQQTTADLPALTSAQAAALEAQGIKPERYKSIAEQMESNPPHSPFAKGEELDDSLDWLDDVVIEDEPFVGGGYG